MRFHAFSKSKRQDCVLVMPHHESTPAKAGTDSGKKMGFASNQKKKSTMNGGYSRA